MTTKVSLRPEHLAENGPWLLSGAGDWDIRCTPFDSEGVPVPSKSEIVDLNLRENIRDNASFQQKLLAMVQSAQSQDVFFEFPTLTTHLAGFALSQDGDTAYALVECPFVAGNTVRGGEIPVRVSAVARYRASNGMWELMLLLDDAKHHQITCDRFGTHLQVLSETKKGQVRINEYSDTVDVPIHIASFRNNKRSRGFVQIWVDGNGGLQSARPWAEIWEITTIYFPGSVAMMRVVPEYDTALSDLGGGTEPNPLLGVASTPGGTAFLRLNGLVWVDDAYTETVNIPGDFTKPKPLHFWLASNYFAPIH